MAPSCPVSSGSPSMAGHPGSVITPLSRRFEVGSRPLPLILHDAVAHRLRTALGCHDQLLRPCARLVSVLIRRGRRVWAAARTDQCCHQQSSNEITDPPVRPFHGSPIWRVLIEHGAGDINAHVTRGLLGPRSYFDQTVINSIGLRGVTVVQIPPLPTPRSSGSSSRSPACAIRAHRWTASSQAYSRLS